MTKEQIEFIPILIGIYITLLSTYWLLKKLPIWLNNPKRLLDRKKRRLVKKLLYYLEETNLWDEWECMGLCGFVRVLRFKDLLTRKELEIFYYFKTDFKPSKIYFKEYPSRDVYWFKPGAKQPRIDYLKRLLNE